MNFRKTPLAAAIALCSTLPAFASEPAKEADETQLKEVKVTAEREAPAYKPEQSSSPKYTAPLRDTPQSVTVVPREVFEDRGAATLGDVLRSVSGISLVAGEGGGARGDNFRIRGFAANTDMFVDGMRDIAQQSNRDPFNLESVEVAKGPSSTYTGRGATGGSINMISKLPQQEDFIGGTVGVGTEGYRRVTGDVNQSLTDSISLRLNLMSHDNDVAGRDITTNSRTGFAPSLAFGLGSATRIIASYQHVEHDNITDYGLPTFQGRLQDSTGTPFGSSFDTENWYGFRNLNTEEQEDKLATLRLEHDFSSNVSLISQLRQVDNDLYSIVTPPRNQSVVNNTVTHNPSVRDSTNELLINQTDLRIRFETGGFEHTISTGFEVSDETFDNQAWTATPTAPLDSLYNPNPYQAYNPTFSRGNLVENEADSTAFYVFDTIKLNDHWQVNLGLRRDIFDLTSTTISNAGVETARTSREDKMTSWNVGAVYKPSEAGSIYVAMATSFNPSAEGGTLAANLEAVKPEESESIELGTKWDLADGKAAFNAAVFQIEKTNARTRELTTDPFTLTGAQEVRGIELGLSGHITDNWAVFGSYTHLDSEITDSANPAEEGNEIGNTPSDTLNLWTTFVIVKNLEVGLGAQYLSERTVSNTVTTELEDYWLYEAMVGYKLTRSIDLRLNVYNLTDEFYFEKFHGGGAHGVPGAGRTAVLNASFQF